jgi:hypothetical protein
MFAQPLNKTLDANAAKDKLKRLLEMRTFMAQAFQKKIRKNYAVSVALSFLPAQTKTPKRAFLCMTSNAKHKA